MITKDLLDKLIKEEIARILSEQSDTRYDNLFELVNEIKTGANDFYLQGQEKQKFDKFVESYRDAFKHNLSSIVSKLQKYKNGSMLISQRFKELLPANQQLQDLISELEGLVNSQNPENISIEMLKQFHDKLYTVSEKYESIIESIPQLKAASELY